MRIFSNTQKTNTQAKAPSQLLALCLLVSSYSAMANDHGHHDDGDFVQLDAHQHGHARLTLVADQSQLWLTLESPAMNLIGVEGVKAQDLNKQQQQALTNALSLLDQEQFAFKGTQCQLESTEVQSPFDEHDDEHHDEEHDEHHDEEQHDKHHDEDHDEHHDDEHDEHHDEDHDEHHDDEHDKHHDEKHDDHESGHDDFTVNWTYHCDDVSKLSSITVDLLPAFSGMEQLAVEYMVGNQQGAANLTQEQWLLEF